MTKIPIDNKREEWQCEGCKTIYAEYVNGCPRCWDDNLNRKENLKKYPNRSVKLVDKRVDPFLKKKLAEFKEKFFLEDNEGMFMPIATPELINFQSRSLSSVLNAQKEEMWLEVQKK